MEVSESFFRELSYSLLGQGSYLLVNRKIIRWRGLDEAIFLSDLIYKEKYFTEREELDSEGFFFNTEKNREDDTGLSAYRQQIALKSLCDDEILSVKRIGLPARQYFKINHENFHSQLSKFSGLVPKVLRTIKNNNINNNNTLNIKRHIKSNKPSATADGTFGSELPPEKEEDKIPVKTRTRGLRRTKGSAVHLAFAQECIDKWNSCPGVQMHTQPDSKVVMSIKQKICWLLTGSFKSQTAVTNAFIEKHSIPGYWLEQKWTKEDILAGIENLSKHALPAYWPSDKTHFRSLDPLLYNEKNQTSWFLAAARTIPTPLRVQYAKDKYPHITSLFKDKLPNCSDDDYIRLIHGIKKIGESYDSLLVYNQFGARFQAFSDFCNYYIEWVDCQKWIRQWNVSLASADSKAYKAFLDDNAEDFRRSW